MGFGGASQIGNVSPPWNANEQGWSQQRKIKDFKVANNYSADIFRIGIKDHFILITEVNNEGTKPIYMHLLHEDSNLTLVECIPARWWLRNFHPIFDFHSSSLNLMI